MVRAVWHHWARGLRRGAGFRRAVAASWPRPAFTFAWPLWAERLEDRITPSIVLGQQPGAANNTQFHGDAARTGDNTNDTVLTPANVASSFGQVWESPVLDGHVYATPLFADSITISGNGNAANHSGDGVQSASFQNKTLGLTFAATGGGSVYAIASQDTDGPTGIAPGTIIWKTHLGNAYGGIDGNSIGVLSTPILDLAAGRIYVTASVTDYLAPASSLAAANPGGTPLSSGGNNFEVFALNLRDGSLVPGWPLIFTQTLLDSIDQNKLAGTGVAVAFSSSGADQRGALNLSADGSTLYIDWACYGSSNGGWLTDVATGISNGVANGQTAAIVSAYSAIDTTAIIANGGMWGAGGPVIDAAGDVFVSTGDSPGGTGNPLGDWGNSVLEFGPGQTLVLTGAYTPWNYETQDTIDSDLGGGSPILINLPTSDNSTTPSLLAVGGKQGNAYLADAGNHLNDPTARPGSPADYPADLTERPSGGAPPGGTGTVTPSEDPSLYDTNTATGTRTYFSPNQVGPLSLFGPYNESSASGNTAKARDTPTTAFGPDGTPYIVWAGASKSGVGSSTPVAPSLYLTKIVTSPGQPAYLQTVAANTAVMSNPGASLITGNGTANQILWIVDAGVQRTDSLNNSPNPFINGEPILYAYNLLTMQPIWSSASTELDMGGKYNSITDARGDIILGTDRIQAFGLTTNTLVDNSVTGTGMNQFTYVGSGWQQITGTSTMGTFDGTVSTDSTPGNYATLNFSGSGIKVYANELSSYGTATISVDGGNAQTITLTTANGSPNGMGEGDVLIYTLTGLSSVGIHTLKVLDSTGTITLDRAEILPGVNTHSTIDVSGTDGNVIPAAAGIIPYTLNYTNAGSILNSTGVNATGVVMTETVPANSSFSAANSTPGWTLASGTGGAGSTYTFAVGNLLAGDTGSLVFSVQLNAQIPANTPTITDNFTVTDSAGDSVSGSRVTPIPPAQETKLIFLQQPPATGGAGVPLSPAVEVAIQDQFGNVYTADNSTVVTLTLSSGTFAGGSTTATATVASGIATFSSLIILNAGTYSLTAASSPSLPGLTSINFTLSGSAKLGILTQPTQTLAGAAVNPGVQVAVQDSAGNTITADNSTVTLTINTGTFANGSLTLTAQAVSGIATFSNIVIDATGSYTLTASDGLLTPAYTNSFNIVTVASKLVYLQQPSNGYAGQAVNPAVTVALEDGFGNIASGDTSTVTLTLSGGTLLGGGTTASLAALNGIATFSNLVIPSAGTFLLAAADGSFAGINSNSFIYTTRTLTLIDDNNANNIGGIPTVNYSSAANWVQSYTTLANNYGGTLTTDTHGGDTATVTFTGTLITVYCALTPAGGAAKVIIDGGAPIDVNLTANASAIAPVYTSPLLAAGSHTIILKVVTGVVSLDHFTVGFATPTVSWATPADITYGSALDGTQLDAFANVAGSFVYSPAAGAVLSAGANQVLSATFTPTDTADYVPAAASVRITVDKSTPVITWPEPDDLTYGQPLSSDQLDAVANVPGTFVYTPALGAMLPTGDNQILNAVFTPTDTNDYNSTTAQTRVDVDAIDPVIVWSNPANINEGTPLGATQLDATEASNIPGMFSYNPPAGTVLSQGSNQPLTVTFTPTDTINYSIQTETVAITVVVGPATKLGFVQQPGSTSSNTTIAPAVQVAVQNVVGSTVSTNTSTITLTLVPLAGATGTFAGGSSTISVAAVAGVATFSNLAITSNGQYSLVASDGSLASSTSNTFTIGSTAYVDFNAGATTFTSQFANNLAGTTPVPPAGNVLAWNAADGISDNTGGTPGGGIHVSGGADESSIYTPQKFNLSDGATHTISMFITAAAGLTSSDREQIGFITSSTAGFNGGYSFISARLFGNHSAEFQSGNGSGTSAVSLDTTTATGTIATGDWLQLILTTKMTSSGSYSGSFSVVDYGTSGTAIPRIVLGPVAYSVTGLTTIGTGSAMYAGFRTATSNGGTGLNFDNFAVDQPVFKLAYLQQPSSGTANVALSPAFIVAVEDINGHIVAGDASTITGTLNQNTFANGATTVSATAVDGFATFSGLTINAAGSYILRATDTNPNLDPGFAPFTIGPAAAAKLGFAQQPSNAVLGTAMTPAVSVAVQDAFGNTVTGNTISVTLTLNGGTFASGGNTVTASAVNGIATFNNLIITALGNYTLTATATGLTAATSSSFSVITDVASVTVNGGAAQRSRLTTIAVNFLNPINVAALGSITLTRTGAISPSGVGTLVQTGATGTNGLITVSPASGLVSSVTLTFSNPNDTPGSPGSVTAGVEYRSLADGVWQLAIPSLGYASPLGSLAISRLFGDINGDGTVDALGDQLPFGAAFGSTIGDSNYNAALDFNNDGTIDALGDQLAFGGRFGLTLP